MNQKWNLQDIKPPSRPKRPAAPPVAHTHDDAATPIAVHTAPQEEAPARPNFDALRQQAREVQRAARPEETTPHFDTIAIVDGTKARRTGFVVAAVVFLCIVGGGFALSALMAGAEVTVIPKQEQRNIDATFVGSPTPAENVVPYELLTLEASNESQVQATGQEEVKEQAKGTILIYNSFSTSPVRLVKNTRFEAPNGLIYKVAESVVVPGYTNKDGQIAPGVIAADVYAEAPGERYNIGPSRFTVPGFAGSPEFEKVYGESTAAMAGGFEGKRFIIDDAELETERQRLHTELRDALLERLKTERPAGFVVFDNAVTFTFNSLPAVAYGDNLATIKEQGVLRVPIFKEEDLARHLAKQSVQTYDDLPVRLKDYQVLSFNYTSPTTTVSDISTEQSLSFTLTGEVDIIWKFKEDELKADLLGIPKTAIPQVLGKYPSIKSAEAEVRPFWQRSFPREMDEIEVIEVLEGE